MSLTGGDSIKALLHDLVESLQHKLDKLALGQRKLYDFLIVPKDRTLEFENRFPVLEDSGIYLLAPAITPVKHGGPPDKWDKDGTIASFSVGSEVSELRRFLLTAKDDNGEKRKRRGKARKSDGKKDPLPPPPPNILAQKLGPVPLMQAESGDYLAAMLKARGQSDEYHRWAVGAGDRNYWKGCPVTTRTVEGDDVGVEEFLGPLAKALQLAKEEDQAGLRNLVEAVKADAESTDDRVAKRVVKGTSDLRRYTINVAPALARAMALLLDHGVEKEKVRDLMVAAAPLVAAEFERVTGRKSVGVSIHFDSNLPHFNIWHTGLEPVIYKVGKSERTRFRRTAMDLNASGNMLAWDRVSRAFARVGEDFSEVSVATAGELKKAEERAQKRQGRPPGDFTINRKADEVLESALKELGYGELIERGYREFVVNERKRYAAAIAGRDGKDLKMIIDLLPRAPGESPLDATRRLVDERAKIEETLGPVHTDGENANLVSAIKNLVETATVAQSNEEQMRGVLQAADGEPLTDAAARVVERTGSLADELGRSSRDAATLRSERDGLKMQADESATVITQVKSALKPDSDESLLAAAKRVTAGAGEAEALKKQAARLSAERDRFKTMADQSWGLLERIRAMLGLTPEEKIVPAVKRVVGEANQVPEVRNRMDVLESDLGLAHKSLGVERKKVQSLEKEIGPLRRLKELFAKLITYLISRDILQKLPNGMQKRLKVMADSVDIKIDITDQEMK